MSLRHWGKEIKMSNNQNGAEEFRLAYEKFLEDCDQAEDTGLWPLEELGQMEGWFANDMACLILRLIASDGEIREEEVRYLNDAFGFDYSVCSLKDVYAECGDRIGTYLEEALPESIGMLEQISPSMANDYRRMLQILARAVIGSDQIIRQEETAAAEKLLGAVQIPL